MDSNGNNPMDEDVHVDEFVLGGREQGKTRRSYDSKKKESDNRCSANRGC